MSSQEDPQDQQAVDEDETAGEQSDEQAGGGESDTGGAADAPDAPDAPDGSDGSDGSDGDDADGAPAAEQDKGEDEPPSDDERIQQIGDRIDKARTQAEDAGVLVEEDEDEFVESGATEEEDDQTIAPPG